MWPKSVILIAVAALLTTEGCRQTPAAQEAAHQADESARANIKANDEAIVAHRGWTQAELYFGSGERADVMPTGLARLAQSAGRSLGPFRIGMNVEQVRAIGRKLSIASSGQFTWSGPMAEAWCAPIVDQPDRGVILGPKQLNMEVPSPAGRFDSYSIDFLPVAGELRVGAVQLVHGDRVTRIGPELQGDAVVTPGVAPFAPCRLTSGESAKLHGWDRLEELGLRDTLGAPQLDRTQLPAASDATLSQWERAVTVPCDGSSDCYALSPNFDGFWQSDGNAVIGTSLWINGMGAHTLPFIVVMNAGGKILWTGRPDEFARLGLQGKQLTAREADGLG